MPRDVTAAHCPLLILVPTRLERQHLERRVAARLAANAVSADAIRWSTVGFGPTVAGTMALEALRQYAPQRAMLAGIAGSLDERFPIGSIVEPDEVAIEGIGAWVDGKLIGPDRLGWRLWEGDSDEPPSTCGELILSLDAGPFGRSRRDGDSPSSSSGAESPVAILTVCAASGSREHASARREAFPRAVAEEMEGHSVAVAARVAEVPLTIVRGISNIAGERDKRRWRIDAALDAVADRLAEMIGALSVTERSGP